MRLRSLLIPLLLSVAAPAVAQEKPEKPEKTPRGPSTLQPGVRDRVPLQIRERDPRATGKPGAPTVPFKGGPGGAAMPPTAAPGAGPRQPGAPTHAPGGAAPTPATPPAAPSQPTPPLPGATSIMGSGKTRVDVTPVTETNGKTAADVDENKRRTAGKALFNFENAQLIDVVKQISKLTGKNFILRENLKGQKLTILCEEPVSSKDAYRAFLVALEINNLAVVQAGKFLKIEERKNSIKQPIPTYFQNDAELPGDEQMVTYIHQLKYVEIDQAQKLVDSMLNKAVGDLQVYQPNLLIMSDSAVNISRIRKLLEKIDVAGYQTRIHILDIKYAPASDIANKLTALFDPNKTAQKKAPVRPAPGAGATPAAAAPAPAGGKEGAPETVGESGLDDYFITKIIADERTNKLIIVGTEDSFNRVKALVELLDVPEGPSNAPQVHVHPLENADSEKLTQALQNLAQAGKKPADKGKKGAATDASMFEGEIKISADPATNSLIIIASQRDYQSLAKVVRRLDVRRPQVFVEAVIMEVTLDRVTDLGLDWFTAYQAPVPGLGTGTGIIANPGGQSRLTSGLRAATVDPTGLSSFLGFLAFRGPGVPVRVGNQTVDLPSFGAVLNALEQDGNVDVLSTPHILTTDNVKAEILVGQTVPFASGFTSNLGGGAISSFVPIVSVQRQDVALKFVITPHVNTSNFVRLELDQEVSDLGATVEVSPGQKQPTTTKRTAKTTVVVKDEQTVIIGGLISDKRTHSESKIPVLGDVPWLGFLFRTPHTELRKTNLMIILTPHIIRSDEDFRRIYERKLQERQEFVEAFYGVNAPYLGPVDFERKVGAYGSLHTRIRDEMMKVENGGPGLPGESVITPESATISTSKPSDELPEGDEGGEVKGAAGAKPEGAEGAAPQGQPPPAGQPPEAGAPPPAPPPADAPATVTPPPAPEPPPPELQ
ncbi:MAG: type II secretion system secretin GspD [Myxococcota bacterium]